MSKDLIKQKCTPCHRGTDPLKGDELQEYLHLLHEEGWKLVKDQKLEKEYSFPNFRHALIFTNIVGELAEREGHHPDIHLSWGKVKIVLWTHSIHGLSPNDFIIAAKIDHALHKVEPQPCF